MANAKEMDLAKQVYRMLCSVLDAQKWNYEKDENEHELLVHFREYIDHFPMIFIISVNVDRQLIRLSSPIIFKMREEKNVEGALAACVASHGLVDGSFDYNIFDGSLSFKRTASFRNCTIGQGWIEEFVFRACSIMSKYNPLLVSLNESVLSLQDFVEKCSQ